MRKRFLSLSLALALVMALTLLPASALAAEQTAGDGTATPIILAFAANNAAQVGSTKEIKMTLTVTASKMWEPDKLQAAFTVKAAVNGASDLAVTLSNGKTPGDKDLSAVGASLSDGLTYLTAFDASFTMPDSMKSFTSKDVALTITSKDESVCTIESGGSLTVPLAKYDAPSAPPDPGKPAPIILAFAASNAAQVGSTKEIKMTLTVTASKMWEPDKLQAAFTVKAAVNGASDLAVTLSNGKTPGDKDLSAVGASLSDGLTYLTAFDASFTMPDSMKSFTSKDVALTITSKDESVCTIESGSSLTAPLAKYDAPSAPPTPPTPPTPNTPSTPSTPSIPSAPSVPGIPSASQVTTPEQAAAAVSAMKNMSLSTFASSVVSSDSGAAAFAALEEAVKAVRGVRVEVDRNRYTVPSVMRAGEVSISGAAFNASNTTVSLVVDAPSKAYSASSGYQVSMTLTGVSNPAKLEVPVVLTLPLPTDVSAENVVVLHYHGGSSTPEAILPAVSGDSIRFAVTGFSDFVVTEGSAASIGNAGGLVSAGGGGRNRASSLDGLLPAIAALVNGDCVFVDVSATHWATKEIRWARDSGLMGGYENGNFRPWAPTARQELWMVLARLAGTRPADMAAAREWAMNAGVSDGTNPHGALSRQQLVTMLYRFAKSQGVNVSASKGLGGYADSGKVASYAKEALSWAAAKGIVGGDSKGNLNPEGTATRAHFAVFLYRYANK